MKIKEFIEKVNENERMEAEEVDGVIAIYNDSDLAVVEIPCDATNLLEIKFVENYYLYSFGKSSREYLSALIEEFLHTSIKERFPKKKYRLVANPNSFEQTGTYATKYVACIQDGMDCFSFVYGGPTVFSEKELKQIEELHPNIAPAIDTMKEEVKDDEAD